MTGIMYFLIMIWKRFASALSLVRIRTLRTETRSTEIFAMGATCFAIMKVATLVMDVLSRMVLLLDRDTDDTVKTTRLLGLLWM